MRPAGDLATYASDPIDRYVAGSTWAHYTRGDGLAGLVLWGKPDAEDIRRMTGALAIELPGRSPHHATLHDVRRLEHADPAAFEVLREFLAQHNERFSKNVSRLAVARPPGMLGAVVAGFFHLVAPLGPTGIFDTIDEALAYLGRRDIEIDAIYEAALGIPPIVRMVRDCLANHRGGLSEVASALGVSERTLQDHLKRAGTSFRRESNEALVRAARQMLESSNASLTEIALSVGCASLQHFSTLFRKVEGVTPTEYRRRLSASR
jgi:AraC-like DNA-binding protein